MFCNSSIALFDSTLYELFSFLITNSQVSRNLIALQSIERYLLVETRFHVETDQLASSGDRLTGSYMVHLIV